MRKFGILCGIETINWTRAEGVVRLERMKGTYLIYDVYIFLHLLLFKL